MIIPLRTVSFEVRLIPVHMYAMFMKSKGANSPVTILKGNKHAKRNLTDFYFKKKKKRNVVGTQLLDALFLPKEITASTRTEAISEILYTSHIPNASNVICPETMTKV